VKREFIDSTIEESTNLDSTLYDVNDTTIFKKNQDTTEIIVKNEKYRSDSLIVKKTISSRRTEFTKIDTILDGKNYWKMKTHVRDTGKIIETYLFRDMIFFETQVTLQSKLDFFARHNLNIGFWNEIEQPKVDGSTLESSTPKNPVIELFNYAKSFFKKLLKLKVQLWHPNPPDGASICPSWDCYWETIVADHKRGLPKTPDYFLILFAPFFALRILMPFLTFGIFNNPFKLLKEKHLLKKLRVKILGVTISGPWALFLESIFWILIAFLFILTMAQPDESEAVRTTRIFSILIIIFLVLGRPVIKFLIKFVRLFGKPFGRSLLKKIWKQVIPHLGTLVNTNFFDEDEMNNAINHVRRANKVVISGHGDENEDQPKSLYEKDSEEEDTEGDTVLLFNLEIKPLPDLNEEELAAKRIEYQWKRLGLFFALKNPNSVEYQNIIEKYREYEFYQPKDGRENDSKEDNGRGNDDSNEENSVTKQEKLYEHSPDVFKLFGTKDQIKLKFAIYQLLLSVLLILAGCWLFSNDRSFVDTFLKSDFALEGTIFRMPTPLVFLLQNLFILYFFFDYFSFYVLKIFSRHA
jgi:hypothetical protein